MKMIAFRKIILFFLAFFVAVSGNIFGQVNHVVVSQVYGGGGNTSAPYTNDFIELFNPTGASVSLSGWSVQYTSATGTTWTSRTNLSGSIAPGGYYLVQGASGGAVGSALPTPDATGTINLSGTVGKVALVSTTVALTGGCPTGGSLVDFVGFGTTADCREGSANTPAPSNTTSVIRAGSGCTDANENSTDFSAGAPNPRNSASSAVYCYATKLVVTSITPNPPTAGTGFSVTVQSQNAGNNLHNVTASTSFSLTTNGNAGVIGGTTTGTITAGSNSVTITGVTLASSGAGATITATRSSGDVLTAGVSSAFNVSALTACTGTPTGGSVSPGITNFCGIGSTSLSLTGGSTGTGLGYQWSSNTSNTPPGTNISGATNSSYTTPSVSTTTYYWCTTTCATSSLSSISSVGALSVTPTPTVTVTPPSGNTGTSLTASGATTYSWSPSVSLSASTGATVVATPTVTTTYTVTGTAYGGCIATTTATVTNLCDGTPSGGTISPGILNVCGSGSTSLSLLGGSPGVGLRYQWSSNSTNTPPGTNISGATNNSYTIPTISSSTYYWCTTTCNTSSLSAISSVGVLSVTPTPTVTVTPPSGRVGASLTASGGMSYVWAPSSGLSATTGATVVASPTVTVTYTITGTGSGGCTSTTTATVSNPSGIVVWNFTAGTFAPASSTIAAVQVSSCTATFFSNGSCGTGTTCGVNSTSVSTGYTGSSGTNNIGIVNAGGVFGSSTSAYASFLLTPSSGFCLKITGITFGERGTGTGPASYKIRTSVDAFGSDIASGSLATTSTWTLYSPTITTVSNSSAIEVRIYGFGGTGTTGAANFRIDDVSISVAADSLPNAISGSASECPGTVTNFSNGVTGGLWSSSNTGVATIGSSSGVLTTLVSGTTVITYTVPTGCYVTKNFTVNPLPASITGSDFCVGSTITYNNATGGGTWSSSATGVASIGSATGVASGVSAGTSVITYQLSATGCYSTTVITVNPLPASITGSDFCVGSTTTYNNATGGGTWSSSATGVATIGSATGVASGVSAGTSVITYQLSATGCYSTTVITVNPLPASITGSDFCVGSPTTYNNSTGGGTWSSSAIGVATIGSASGVASGVSAGTSVITYQLSATGCYSTTVITVNPLPTSITGSDFCVGSTTTYNNATGGGTWSSSATGVATIGSTTGVASGVGAGTSVITYQLSATGCYSTTVITVNPLPASITGSDFCVGSTTTYNNATGGGSWSSSATGVATIGSASGVASGVSAGTSVITYQLSATGCYSTTVITVTPLPTSITGSDFCVGSTTTYNNATGGGTWSSSATGVATIGSTTGVASGVGAGTSVITYQLSPTGCYSTTVITVNPLPASITGSDFCVGSTTTYNNASGGGSWSSSATGVATIGSATGVASGVSAGTSVITYQLSATGCYSTTVITVNPIPAAITGSDFCVGSTTTFNNATGGGNWSSSATVIVTIGSASGVASGVSAGTSVITYQLSATGCYSTTVITVNPLPTSITGSDFCVGSTTTYNNTTGGGTWSSSATGVATIGSATGIATGVSAGTSVITYQLSATGCYSTTVVTVNPLPASITGTTLVCQAATTTLANVAGGGSWSSSATGVATVGTGIVTGVAAGTSIISYIQPTGCFATTIVTVNPTPAVITGTASACPGFTSTLSSATPSGNWSSSALGVATVGTLTGVVSAVSAGTTTISYTRSNACYATATFTTNPLPAAISATGNVCAGFTTTYTGATGGGTWSSSATGVATVGSGTGVVTGVAAGSATITYTLGTGCYATAAVTVNAAPATIGGTAKACAGFSTTLTNATGGGTWTSGATGIATVGTGTGVVTAVSAGTATITYTRSNGCFATKEYTVNALPATIGGTPNACLGFTSTLTNATGGGTWTSSVPSIATVGTGTGTVTGIAAASATITYTLSTGCYATSGFTINANPATIGGTKTACEGFGTTLTNATGGGTWASANTGIATVGSTSGAVLGVSAGTTTITYTRSDGCYATTTYTVNTTPAAIGGTLNSCIGFTSTLTDATGGGAWTSASTGVAIAGAGTGVITGITAGTANITYALSTGCYASANYTVNANPATIGGTTNVCTSGTTTLTDATGGGAWSVSNANATMGTGSGVVTGVTAGTAVVSYTLSTGCYKTTNINIYETPATISGAGSLCAGGTTTLSNSVSGGVWSSSSTTVASVGSTTGIVTGVAGGTANITYNTGGSCYTTFTTTIGAILPITGTPSACTGASSTLSCGSAGGTWSSSNTAVATIGSTGVMTGVSVGTSIVTYALPSGCARYVTVYISDPGSSISGPSSVCVGQTITLTDAAAPGGAWTSSNGGIASVGLFTGVVTGRLASTVNITYTLGSSCYITKSLTVNAFSPSYAAVTNVMVGNTITVGNAMSGGTWSSSATGVATVNSTTGVVTGVSAGTASISYAVSSGCTDYINVTVNAAPSPISGPSVVCIGQAVTLTSGTPGGMWTSSNGGIATVGSGTGIVTGRIANTVNITYTVGGAYSVRTMTVTAFTPSYASVYTVMSGNTISMNNTTSGGNWSSTNTGVATVNSTSGLVTGVGAGTTIISYAVASGCSDGTTITVTAAPSAITGPSVVCFSQTATLSSATPGGIWTSSNGAIATVGSSTGIVTPLIAAPVNITYTVGSGYAVKSMTVANFSPVYASVTTINSGNTTTIFDATSGGVWSSNAPAIATVNSTSGVVTGVLSGTTMISYTMPTGCTDGIMVTVAPAPAIGTGPGTVCVGNTRTLTHATPGGVWTSSNGGVASVGSSTGIVTGRIASTCTITYTLPTSVIVTTTINVLPLAAISGQTKICNGQSLTLTNSISGGTWYSSNGGVAAAGSTTGVISGVSTGTSIISYVLPTGCYALKTVTVVAAMTGITGTPEVCNGSSVTLGHAISGGAWSSSNTGVATAVLFGGSITGVSPGTSSITYTVGPACKASVTFTVDPVPAAIGGGNSVCVSTPITLTDATAGGVWSSLDPSIATVGSSDGLVTGVTSGFTTTISYTLSGTGCYAVNSMAVNPCRIAGEEEVTKASAFSLIPNPNSGTFTLKGRYAAATSEEEVSIEVVNTLGQSVYRSTIKAEQGRINEQVTLPGTLANGMYLLNLHTPNEQAVFHFVISK